MKSILLFAIGLVVFSSTTFAQAPTDYNDVCTKIGDAAQNQLDYSGTFQEITKTGTAVEIFRQPLGVESGLIPWILTMSTRVYARKAAYTYQLVRAQIYAFSGNHGDVQAPPVPTPDPSPTPIQVLPETPALENYLSYYSQNEPVYPSELKQLVHSYLNSYSQDGNIDQLIKFAPIVCLKYLTPGCSDALVRALNIMRPRGGTRAWISLLEEVEEIVTDPSYVKPLSKAALTVMKRIKDAENGIQVSGNVFDDLVSAFLDSGFSNSEAVERTWKVMGFYSGRGASMEFLAMDYIRTAENTPAYIPFFVISAGMNYLDVLSSERDKLYSYPPTVKMTCKAGKPYHFWNSAYITHRLIKEGYSVKASALSMHLSGLFYDVFSSTYGRDPYQIYRVTHFSSSNNSLRLDVVQHSLGATFAAKSATTFFDGDRNFGVLFREGKPLKAPKTAAEIQQIAADRLKHFTLWNEIMAPDSSFADLW